MLDAPPKPPSFKAFDKGSEELPWDSPAELRLEMAFYMSDCRLVIENEDGRNQFLLLGKVKAIEVFIGRCVGCIMRRPCSVL